jgi:protein involved in polysaccharide export with SLBB domain
MGRLRKLVRRSSRRLFTLSPCYLVTLSLLAGCSSPSSHLSSLPHANALIPPAEAIRKHTCPPPAIARELDKHVAEPYVVEPGDVLLVQPASLESPLRLPGDQVVLPDGTVQLGRFGRLGVAGKTIEQIEAEVNAHIRALVPECGLLVVRLVTRDSKVFYVQGEVNAPGAFPLRGRETVLDAIIAAGGLNSNASRRRIILARPTAPDSCRVVLPVDYSAIVQLGDTTTNYQVRAGDRVFVPTKTFWEELCALKDKAKGGHPEGCCGALEASPPTYAAPAHRPAVVLPAAPSAAPGAGPAELPPPNAVDLPPAAAPKR